jgi:hypothetical protein
MLPFHGKIFALIKRREQTGQPAVIGFRSKRKRKGVAKQVRVEFRFSGLRHLRFDSLFLQAFYFHRSLLYSNTRCLVSLTRAVRRYLPPYAG